jgi:sugar phosphate permease
MLQNSKIRLIAGAYFLVKITRYSLLFWLPLYLTDYLKMSLVRAGYVSSVFEVVGIVGVLAAAYLSDFVFGARRLPVAFLFTSMLACGCMLTSMIEPSVRDLSLFAFAILGACTFGADTLLVGVATQESAAEGKVGTATGFVDGCGSLGQLLAPILVVNISQLFGWPNVFRCLGVAALVCSYILRGGFQSEHRKALHEEETFVY